MFIGIGICLLVLIAFPVQANERDDKIRTLMHAVGLIDMWTQQIEMGKQQNVLTAQQMIEQTMSQLNPDEAFQQRFNLAYNKFISKVQVPWTVDEIADVWANHYGPGFSDSELDQLIVFYTSPLGQKDVRKSKEAMIAFTEFFRSARKPMMATATDEYVNELKQIAKECDCAK